ncbi:hypothetical protein L3X38_004078 [Prunus dulcis]|uniref:Uncharacterized protein n=1 Tax=Prunus dulcis TaxID=3755 RepID=A0AAD4ZN74_PRUDU|nr:hypothetical protein L3X38_004078 [Prunus dulcis]
MRSRADHVFPEFCEDMCSRAAYVSPDFCEDMSSRADHGSLEFYKNATYMFCKVDCAQRLGLFEFAVHVPFSRETLPVFR